ncbi:MAG: hypothetical protein M5R41_06590 [Bacteroidia bacterium]|nr:hypothetical protein [Bacteroidia bacterium]
MKRICISDGNVTTFPQLSTIVPTWSEANLYVTAAVKSVPFSPPASIKNESLPDFEFGRQLDPPPEHITRVNMLMVTCTTPASL